LFLPPEGKLVGKKGGKKKERESSQKLGIKNRGGKKRGRDRPSSPSLKKGGGAYILNKKKKKKNPQKNDKFLKKKNFPHRSIWEKKKGFVPGKFWKKDPLRAAALTKKENALLHLDNAEKKEVGFRFRSE